VRQRRVRAFADEIAERMGMFAKELGQQFDLSEETARLKSAGAVAGSVGIEVA